MVEHTVVLGVCTRRIYIARQRLSNTLCGGLISLAQLGQLVLKHALQILRHNNVIQHATVPALMWENNPAVVIVMTTLSTQVAHRGRWASAVRRSTGVVAFLITGTYGPSLPRAITTAITPTVGVIAVALIVTLPGTETRSKNSYLRLYVRQFGINHRLQELANALH
jgi:hypothetical protein